MGFTTWLSKDFFLNFSLSKVTPINAKIQLFPSFLCNVRVTLIVIFVRSSFINARGLDGIKISFPYRSTNQSLSDAMLQSFFYIDITT